MYLEKMSPFQMSASLIREGGWREGVGGWVGGVIIRRYVTTALGNLVMRWRYSVTPVWFKGIRKIPPTTIIVPC